MVAHLKMTSFMENPFAKFSHKLLIARFVISVITRSTSSHYTNDRMKLSSSEPYSKEVGMYLSEDMLAHMQNKMDQES